MIFETVTDFLILWLGTERRLGKRSRHEVRNAMQGGLSVECWRRSRGVLKLGESEAVVLGLHDKALFEN
jgi:hypothetical protein